MLYGYLALQGYKLECTDGQIGQVKDFYFDDQHWAIRYLVAETGKWLPGRKVLISPYALLDVVEDDEDIAVNLTKKQIEDSPALDTDAPVSKQFEDTYYGYYGWPMYWEGPYMWGTYSYPYVQPIRRAVNPREPDKHINTGGKTWDPHLRSAHDVTGHHVQAKDGEIGHVEDFLIDDATWAIRYLVIKTKNWLPGKRVLVAPSWIDRVSWDESKVFTSLSREAIQQAPEYTEVEAVTREYELDLHKHYERKGYWIDEPAADAALATTG